jgi:hypothetical protein
MYFYINENNLYSSEIPLINDNFLEISEEEYNNKIKIIQTNKEMSNLDDLYEDFWGE